MPNLIHSEPVKQLPSQIPAFISEPVQLNRATPNVDNTADAGYPQLELKSQHPSSSINRHYKRPLSSSSSVPFRHSWTSTSDAPVKLLPYLYISSAQSANDVVSFCSCCTCACGLCFCCCLMSSVVKGEEEKKGLAIRKTMGALFVPMNFSLHMSLCLHISTPIYISLSLPCIFRFVLTLLEPFFPHRISSSNMVSRTSST